VPVPVPVPVPGALFSRTPRRDETRSGTGTGTGERETVRTPKTPGIGGAGTGRGVLWVFLHPPKLSDPGVFGVLAVDPRDVYAHAYVNARAHFFGPNASAC